MEPTGTTNLVFNIGTVDAFFMVFAVCVAIVSGAWWLASRLSRIETKVEGFETRLTTWEGRQAQAFASASPIALKPVGTRALEGSGLKTWVDERQAQLLEGCVKNNTMANPYDIQEGAFKFMDNLDYGDFEDSLKKAAYNYGWSVSEESTSATYVLRHMASHPKT